MKKHEILKAKIAVAETHSFRLQQALKKVKSYFPLTIELVAHLDDEIYPYMIQMIAKFSALQDIIGAKIFPLYLELMIESDIERMTFIDRLNRLEKMGIIESAEMWKDHRDLRNQVTHDYPEDSEMSMAFLNAVYQHSQSLLREWAQIKDKISETNF